jgi:transcriptional regulator with XRE-family HTH domain
MSKESIDPALLYSALSAARQERGNPSWRSLAQEIGVSPSLLSRLANGQKPDADGFATLVTWLRLPAERFFRRHDASAEEPVLMAQLAPLLRARKDLTDQDVKYLEDIIAVALQRTRAAES